MPKQLLVVIALIGLAAAFYVAQRQRALGPGSAVLSNIATHPPAPGFSLSTLTGEKLDLASYRGKVVLLDFWATWCEPCREEIPHFVELQDRYRDQGLQIIGVSMDDGPQPVRDFYQRFKMNYPVVMGDAKTGELYGGVLGLPIAFLINRDGRIYAKHIGATDVSVLEKEIVSLLSSKLNSAQPDSKQGLPADVRGHHPFVISQQFPGQFVCLFSP